MEMQDKEFDQLFNAKLGDFEVEPSEQVWQSIAGELNGKKAKRSIMPYLSIAASIVVLASVSLWFFNQTQEKPEHPVKIVKIKPIKPLSTPETVAAPVAIDRVEDDTYLKQAAVASVEARNETNASKVPKVEQVKEETTVASPNPVMQNTEPLLAILPPEKALVLKPAISANDVALTAITLTDHPIENMETHTGASNIPLAEKAPLKKRAGGLGGFLNTIIAAVDKREDKLIEFTDADNDEGSRVTGVNLGIFKMKKQ